MKRVNRPKTFSVEIRHTAECAFQRAIILGKQSDLNGKTVKWLDIEIPVDVSGRARGKCIDLIGIDEDGNYVLCELKFRKHYRDNGDPEEAAIQLREYYELVKANYPQYPYFYGHKNGKFIDWTQVANGNTRLVIVANKGYWNSWMGKSRKGRIYETKGIECYLIDVNEDTFIKQKGNRESYKPSMPDEGREWYRV